MKQTFKPLLICLTLLALILGAPGSVVAASANGPLQAQKTSPEGLLNADGTLNLNDGFYGALDLDGWNVQVDPERGPIFAPALASPGQWANVGASSNGSLNHYVNAIAVSGTDVYVGGYFTNVSNNGTTLPAADYIAKWNGSAWSALGSNGAGNGSLNSLVNAIAVSGTDVYVGGGFTDVNNNGTVLPEADYIAKWDGSAWSALGSNGAGNGSFRTFTNVNVIAVGGTDVYVGGYFWDVNNNGTLLHAADHIVKWDTLTSNWLALGSDGAGNSSLKHRVDAIAISGTNVYVGGWFRDVNNNGTVLPAADYIAKWNAQTGNWSALGSNGADNGSLKANVRAIAISGTIIYVGGNFTDVNNKGTVLPAADYVAKWNGANWSALGSNGAGNGSLNGEIRAILISGTNVYVGGNFKDVNNKGTILTAADYIAKWNGTNWSALSSNGAGNGSISGGIFALAASGTNVYVGGIFKDLAKNGNSLAVADYIAKWNGGWSVLSSNGVDGVVGEGRVRAVAVSGTNIYVGGGFTDLSQNGIALPAADYIAKWDGTTWSALGSNGAGNGSIDGIVNAIAVIGTDVYVGGEFMDVNNNGTILTAADRIAKWNGSSWSALGSNGAGNGSLNKPVQAMAARGTYLYVGGEFTNVKSNGKVLHSADYITKWTGTSWEPLGSDGTEDGSLNNSVYAIAVSGKDVYVGGEFTDTNNYGAALGAADYVAKWNTQTANWSALGSDGLGNGSLNSRVNALALSGTNLYVGGLFTNVINNGTLLPAADYIAKWNGTGWSALGSNGAGDGAINQIVDSIAVNGSIVFVGGYFTDVNNDGAILTAADYVAKWNDTGWSALGSNGAGNGSLKYEVHALAVGGTNLYVGGAFVNVNNKGMVLYAADHFAAYGLGAVPTATPTRTVTTTQTPTITTTLTITPTVTATPSPTVTITETMTATPTLTETVTETPTPTETVTETPTVTATAVP